jgi:hypothetical protein
MHPPNGALISDNNDSLILVDTESEGDFVGVNNVNGDDVGLEGNIPHEGAQGSNNFATDGKSCCRSIRTKNPIERLVPSDNSIKSYPETVWKSDADGRLERFNLWTF